MLRLAPCRQLSLTILLGDCVSRAAPFLWAVFFFFFFSSDMAPLGGMDPLQWEKQTPIVIIDLRMGVP